MCHYAFVVGSYCANVTAVLSPRHLCLLHAVHFDASGTLSDLFLTKSSGNDSYLLALALFFLMHMNRKTE